MTAYISQCGYCHETQFTQWYSKSAPRDRHGRIDRDYLDSEPVAYCSEEHRDAADALAETVARQGALPVPVGPVPQVLPLSGPVCSQAEARAAGLDVAPSVEELDAMAESVVALGDPLSAEVSLARAVPLLGAAVTGLRARVAELEAGLPAMQKALFKALDRVTELEAERHSTNEALDDAVQALRANAEQALPWAHAMPDDDLSGFLSDLAGAALDRWRHDPEVPDRETLAGIEKVCADWRTPGEGYRSDPEPEAAPDAVSRVFSPVASLREPDGEFHGALHHAYRVGHDLPETGGEHR